MSDFLGKISFNIFGEYENFDAWDAAEEEKEREIEKKSEKRHKELSAEELNKIKEEKDEPNTKKTTKWAVNILKDFLTQKNLDPNNTLQMR